MTRNLVVLLGAPGTLAGLDHALDRVGAQLVTYPLLAFDEPTDWAPVDAAIRRLSDYGCIAVTSPRAGMALAQRLRLHPVAPGRIPPVWATGHASAAPLRALGFDCQVTEEASHLVGAAKQLAQAMIRARVGGPVLFACGDLHRPDLVDGLEQAGLTVDKVICYRTNTAHPGPARQLLSEAGTVVITSPSAVEAMRTALGAIPVDVPVVTLGATTHAAAVEAGWPSVWIAETPTPDAVAELIARLTGAAMHASAL